MKQNELEKIRTIAIVGAGIMGEGIAQGFAQAGYTVKLFDLNDDILASCKRNIETNLNTFSQFQLLNESSETVLSRIQFKKSDGTHQAYLDVEFIVEVLPEIFELKQTFFAELDALPEHVILASNTSSMTISKIAGNMKSAHRLIGLHYFNPANIIPAVEIHIGSQTSQNVINVTQALMQRIGKQPVLVRKEVPGFIINRLTGAMEREIDFLLDEGVVTPEDLDIAVKASFGFRLACMGPMEAEDMIGLDTAARASANIFPTLSNASKPSPGLLEKVEKGEIGIKSGKGWYGYPANAKTENTTKINEKLLRQLKLFQQNNNKV
jgi:3-hydroxyacyl-CoA dehydrogenase